MQAAGHGGDRGIPGRLDNHPERRPETARLLVDPVGHPALRADGSKARFGLPDDPAVAAVRDAWFGFANMPERRAPAARMRGEALVDVPLGRFSVPTALRSDWPDPVDGSAIYGNVRRAARIASRRRGYGFGEGMPIQPPGRPMTAPVTALRCRLIEDGDLDAVVAILGEGFPDRPPAYWRRGLERLRTRALPEGVPRYGYLLDNGGTVVGVLFTLYTRIADVDGGYLRCNLSSWYVDPRFRTVASLLDGRAMRDKRTTYLNISPAPHTWAMHEARGFARYCRGQMVVVPALSRRSPGQRIEAASPDNLIELSGGERALATDHQSYGCRVLVCHEEGRTRVIVLRPRTLKFWDGQRRGPRLPCLQLVFGPSGRELGRWLGSIGRYLMLRGAAPFLLFDADEPLPGTVGRHFAGRARRYAKGPHGVALGDLAYTELVLFGP